MPIEEFLARLVKSKMAGASIVAIYNSVEKDPEVDLRANVIDLDTIKKVSVGADAVMKDKDKEKKHHHDSHSSRGHHSKRYKECVNRPISDEMEFTTLVGGSCVHHAVSGGDSTRPLSKALLACKDYMEKLSAELERVLNLSEASDVDEATHLRNKVKGLEVAKVELEKSLEEMTKKNDSSASQIFTFLTEKSELLA
ncbi:uncharacterized protein LOC141676855 [Apium graveolens]|uniref:uncharacterized protein LOC141676855 n=1 Tax=Apium graveolens TaxID=4045 RepID=UPI003D7B964C